MLQFAHDGTVLETADHGVDDGVVVWIQGVKDRFGQFVRDRERVEEAYKLIGRRIGIDSVVAGVRAEPVKHDAVVVAAAAVMELHHPPETMVFPAQEKQ